LFWALQCQMEFRTPDEWANANADRWYRFANLRRAYFEGVQDVDDTMQANQDLEEMKREAT